MAGGAEFSPMLQLLNEDITCPAADKEYAKALNSPGAKKMDQENKVSS